MSHFSPFTPHNKVTEVAQAPSHRSYYRWVILGIVFLTLFTVVSAMGIATLFIRSWRSEFGWDMAAITRALSIQLILSGPAGIIAGSLADRFGPKQVFIAYLVAAAVGVLGVAGMNKLWQLYLFYGVFIGIGTAVHPIITPLVAKWFRRGRGFAIGISQQADLLGLATLGPLMLILNETIGWRISWLAMGLVTLTVVLPLILKYLKPSMSESLATAGAQAKAASLEGATLGQARRSRSFWMFLTSNFFCGFTARYFWLLVAPIAQEGGMSPVQVGLTVTIAGLAALPGMLLFGAACDRVRRMTLVSIDFAVRSIAYLMIALYLWTHEVTLMFVAAGISGFLIRSTSPPFTIAWINCFGFRSLGKLLGISGTIHQVGGALSLSIAGYLFDRTGSYATTALACSILLVVASIVAWRTTEKKCYTLTETTATLQPEKLSGLHPYN